MRFAFSEDQIMFRDAVRDVLKKECPPTEVRKAWEGEQAALPELWSTLAEMGFDELDLVLCLEESGYAALPDPFLETTALAIPLLEAHGSDALKEQYLGPAAAGELILTVGLESEAHVVSADRAALLILQSGDALHAVPRAEVELTKLKSVDRARDIYTVKWEPSDATKLVSGDAGEAAIALTFDRAAVASAAQLVGLSQQMLDMTVEYAKVREQFGKPIGSFQAVKHHLSNAMIQVSFARPVVHRGAYALSNNTDERRVHVSMAKLYASEAHRFVAKQALQVHGAIGYTIECDLHFFMKRGWALSACYGDAAYHRENVAEVVLGPR